MQQKSASLADTFLQNFDIDLVLSRSQREQMGLVRYRVYCEEFGYEPADAFPAHRESDKFDDYAVHCLVTHRSSGLPAGCVRLICAEDGRPLPLETYCGNSVHLGHLEELGRERDTLCELSRLAVDSTFRKRRGEDHSRLGEIDQVNSRHCDNRSFSLVGFAALLSAFALAELTGRPRIYAMMEPKLPRLLRQAGIITEKAGDCVDYHGLRGAYFVTLDQALDGLRDELKQLYDMIYNRLARQWELRLQVA